ncbi:S8 family peptidase [Tissierella carlieri]|uniref:S8 family peptidase n=1 Tax=Tissierella carlieri TaxID=689904 RepID=A0ABT1S6B2_9FIRM|nr:S8 family serine peptidase [Tissierella carlieri]MCQ4922010.1 S8 family peptidase [Tissierella carlieri]
MKRFLCLFLAMIISLVGCTLSKPIEKETSEISKQPEEILETSEQSDGSRTLLSPENQLSIVRKPSAPDFSFINPGKMKELPSYDSDSDEMWQIDLRSSDLTNLDLSGRLNDLLNADFDSKTKWPDKLPDGFNPQMLMELGKNPGLGIRKLHKEGITGKGIGIAIIDQALLVDHVEYKEQLKMYEEIHCFDETAQMHGPAVASIAVGKTVGAAPEADLYYIAETHGVYKGQGEFDWDLSWIAKSIDRIVEVNKTLPREEKIRVISISLGVGGNMNGYEQVFDSIEKAKEEGIYTVYVGSNPYFGLGRNPLKSPDDITSFTKGDFWKKQIYENDRLLVPMDYRCTASPTGVDDYAFYKEGGMSWTVPYIAGLYALACQVNPDITPETFWREAFNTSDTISADNNSQEKLGKIVNPIKLIEKIGKIK